MLSNRVTTVFLAATIAGCSSPATSHDAGTTDAARVDVRTTPDAATLDAIADATGRPDVVPSPDVAPSPDVTPSPDVVTPPDSGGSGSPGCGAGTAAGGYRNGVMLTSGGVARTYAISVPAGYDSTRAYAVVFVYHGDGGTGDGIRTGFSIEASAGDNAIFVYPDAQPPDRSFDLESPLASNLDLQFFQDALALVRTQYCVDDTRVFAAGMSRGGFFANILGCRIGLPTIRAIGPHSGSIYSADASGYTTDGHVVCEGTPPSAMLFHGDADSVVAVTDGQYARDQWVWADACSDTTTPYAPSPCVEYSGCAAGKRVVWCEIPGLDHAVWGSAGAAVWTFFDSFH